MKCSSRVRATARKQTLFLFSQWFLPFTDEDLAAMYLSDKKAGKPRQLADHEDLEVLLESFSKQVEELVNESETTLVSSPFFVTKATPQTRCSPTSPRSGEYPFTDLTNTPHSCITLLGEYTMDPGDCGANP